MNALCDPRGRYYGESLVWVRESEMPCVTKVRAPFVPPAMLTPKTKKLRKVSSLCSNKKCRKPLELERVGRYRYCAMCATAAQAKSRTKQAAKAEQERNRLEFYESVLSKA